MVVLLSQYIVIDCIDPSIMDICLRNLLIQTTSLPASDMVTYSDSDSFEVNLKTITAPPPSVNSHRQVNFELTLPEVQFASL